MIGTPKVVAGEERDEVERLAIAAAAFVVAAPVVLTGVIAAVAAPEVVCSLIEILCPRLLGGQSAGIFSTYIFRRRGTFLIYFLSWSLFTALPLLAIFPTSLSSGDLEGREGRLLRFWFLLLQLLLPLLLLLLLLEK